ncbi:hypothetical protein CJF42_21455 [Pseudoalteromonas sp. NBT06-2]|nr:hypothetical protein CJF42_21455 [Pseudoalteromonas sp. NBT06-2]
MYFHVNSITTVVLILAIITNSVLLYLQIKGKGITKKQCIVNLVLSLTIFIIGWVYFIYVIYKRPIFAEARSKKA